MSDAQRAAGYQAISSATGADAGDFPGATAGARSDAGALAPPRAVARPDFERLAPPLIFLLITACIGADFASDIVGGESAVHIVGMGFGTILSLGGLVLMMRALVRSRATAEELAAALDRTRADATRWRDRAGQVLQGLGVLIDKQFLEWGLSPSERDVGLLLLKGLSLKDIAGVRKASEATVRQQAQAIYRKSALAGRAELSAFFLEDLLLPQVRSAANTPVPAVPTPEFARD